MESNAQLDVSCVSLSAAVSGALLTCGRRAVKHRPSPHAAACLLLFSVMKIQQEILLLNANIQAGAERSGCVEAAVMRDPRLKPSTPVCSTGVFQ